MHLRGLCHELTKQVSNAAELERHFISRHEAQSIREAVVEVLNKLDSVVNTTEQYRTDIKDSHREMKHDIKSLQEQISTLNMDMKHLKLTHMIRSVSV